MERRAEDVGDSGKEVGSTVKGLRKRNVNFYDVLSKMTIMTAEHDLIGFFFHLDVFCKCTVSFKSVSQMQNAILH